MSWVWRLKRGFDIESLIALLEGDWRETIRLVAPQRAVVTIFDEDRTGQVDEAALISEPDLADDWNRPEEDAAWSHLQSGR